MPSGTRPSGSTPRRSPSTRGSPQWPRTHLRGRFPSAGIRRAGRGCGRYTGRPRRTRRRRTRCSRRRHSRWELGVCTASIRSRAPKLVWRDGCGHVGKSSRDHLVDVPVRGVRRRGRLRRHRRTVRATRSSRTRAYPARSRAPTPSSTSTRARTGYTTTARCAPATSPRTFSSTSKRSPGPPRRVRPSSCSNRPRLCRYSPS